ncbi:MAG: lipopolysaccharide heptosyltransferase I [Caulobacterales bacterium]
MTRVLLVKTSSLGDVIHCLPAVSDMARRVPDLQLDWVVEESLAEIPQLHPAVRRTIPIGMRRWRRQPLAAETWREFSALRRTLRETPYDLVIDAQGLMRIAWLGRLAEGPLCGFDHKSVREPLASLVYQRRFPVSVTLHAVERTRRLVGQALGYELPSALDYGLHIEGARPTWLAPGRYMVALHSTARADKAWDEANWIELGRRAEALDLAVVLPWGSPDDLERAKRIARTMQRAIIPPRLSYTEAAELMAGAAVVAGLDTGLTHLASAVGAPVVALYLASWLEFNGVVGAGFVANLGGPEEPPRVDQVWSTVKAALAEGRRAPGPWTPATAPPAPELAKRRRFRPSNARAVVHRR